MQSCSVTTSGHGRMTGVNSGCGTHSTAAPAARSNRASDQDRCAANSGMSVLMTSAWAGS